MENVIKNWYVGKFTNDELGKGISQRATFKGLEDNVARVYDYLGVHDSIVRERVFEELSGRMNVPYKFIYDKWLELVK